LIPGVATFIVLGACATMRPGNGGAAASYTARDSAEAAASATGFLAAFDSLKFDEFRSYFDPGMTMFFPFASATKRVDGRDSVEAIFRSFFSRARQSMQNAGRPILQGLHPRDLAVQMAGASGAVVSFHLGAEATPARRTIVMVKRPDGWKVLHWHASISTPSTTGR
jgi:hypothetical protein